MPPKTRIPNHVESKEAVKNLKKQLEFSDGSIIGVHRDYAQVLFEYISHLEDELGQMVEAYHGVPSSFFHNAKDSGLTYRTKEEPLYDYYLQDSEWLGANNGSNPVHPTKTLFP